MVVTFGLLKMTDQEITARRKQHSEVDVQQVSCKVAMGLTT